MLLGTLRVKQGRSYEKKEYINDKMDAGDLDPLDSHRLWHLPDSKKYGYGLFIQCFFTTKLFFPIPGKYVRITKPGPLIQWVF
jgi:hypothetical protein